MKAVSEEEEEEEEEDNDNLERNAVPTVSDWMKAVREPDWAVWEEGDQPGDPDRNLRIRDRPEIS